MAAASPTVRRRRLGIEMRRLREQAGLLIETVARELECSMSKISRIETGKAVARTRDIRDMLTMYGVADERQRELLLSLTREAQRHGWWEQYDRILPPGLNTYIGLEAEAAVVRGYEPHVVPGLLQTADYARTVIRAEHPDASVDEVDRRVELRMRRQANDSPPQLWVILDEAALKRPIGGRETFREQLRQLIEVTEQPRVTVQILPFTAGEYGSMGSAFSLLAFPEPADPGIVYVETRAGSLYLEGQEVREFNRVFEHLVATAVSARESRTLIQEAIDER